MEMSVMNLIALLIHAFAQGPGTRPVYVSCSGRRVNSTCEYSHDVIQLSSLDWGR